MTQPAKRSQKPKVVKGLQRGMWVLFCLMVITIIVDLIWFNIFAVNTSTHTLVWAKSFALGALLNYISHFVFTWFAYRYTGIKARKHIVNQLYLGEISKWFISLVGFSLLFITIKPLAPLGLLIGFIVMQISQAIVFLKLK